ncbi:MAG: LTA synthase family protein [Candidatus Zixiibacteriota bacterium]
MNDSRTTKQTYFPPAALYVVLSAILLISFFELWRLVLLIATYDLAEGVPILFLVRSFVVGLRFDLAVTSFIMLPVCLFATLWRWRAPRIISVGIIIIVAVMSFLAQLVDIEFFRFFNARLNGVALNWSDSPGFMASMLWQMYPVVQYLLLYAVIVSIFVMLLIGVYRWTISSVTSTPLWIELVSVVVLVALFALGARGRIEEKSPLRWGVAYFSEYTYANQLALNPTYTFLYDAVYWSGDHERLDFAMTAIASEDADSVVTSLLGPAVERTSNGRLVRHIRFETPNDNPPNVILIIMESFGATRIGVLDSRYALDLSPCFDSLSRGGVLFTNCYSAGMHTYCGVFSSLCGMPHLIGKSLMKGVTGRFYHHSLPSILRDYDYKTLFFVTHDPHFDNMQGFVMANGIDRVIALDDYSASEKLSTLGVPDHVMFDRALAELKRLVPDRFFATLLTASNHGPWLVPDVDFARVSSDHPDAAQLNAFKYSDWALGRFIRQLESDPSFANTLVVVTADNGLMHGSRSDLDLTQFTIPLLLYRIGDTNNASVQLESVASQLDILATIMGRLRLNYDNYTFGRDLLGSAAQATPFAHFSELYSIGYVRDSSYTISRINSAPSLYDLSDLARDQVDTSGIAAASYAREAYAIMYSAYMNMQRPLDTAHTSGWRTRK